MKLFNSGGGTKQECNKSLRTIDITLKAQYRTSYYNHHPLIYVSNVS